MSFTQSIARLGSLVKVSHTVFALPFALSAAVLASAYAELTWRKVLLIVFCITAARTAAMAFNRLVDRHIDGRNPRTRNRELPAGVLSVGMVRGLVVISVLAFVAGAYALGPVPAMLSPIALSLALGYSYAKRFTSWCHLILGAAIALAPGGAWIAMGAPVTLAPWLLVIGVATWVGGFDVLYSLQDREFDQDNALYSIPTRFGVTGALWISGLLHVVTVACLSVVGVLLQRGPAYAAGVILVFAILAYEHGIVRPNDLSRINMAFFDLNGYVSVGFLLCVLADHYLLGG